MLEGFSFFRKKETKETAVPGGTKRELAPGFQADPEMENIVNGYIEVLRRRYGYTMDGTKEDIERENKKAKEIEDQYGERMRSYLKPYIDIEGEKIPAYNVPRSEHNRWQTANTLKAMDRKAGELK